MESHPSTQLKVGIYLTVGLIVILGSIFFLGADKALFTSYTRLHSHFEQVQGLAVGSVVSLSGVVVGNVEDITFVPDKNYLDVKLKVNTKFLNRIREGSQVEIRTQGALGDKFVYIIPGDPRNPVVKEGDVLEIAKATDLIGILSERGSEANKIFDIITELQKITHAINAEGGLVKTMANLEVATGHFSRASKDAQAVLEKMAQGNAGEKFAAATDRLESILGKIDRGEGSLGLLVNDPSVHNQLKSFLGGSSRKNHVKSLLRTSIEKED
ncbi:MlaD family protein [Bdellovibrio sp. HCB2-146]|uniref:MlaD family protein n=1 Tax=Bdellovibrio sp. HCB2-146 TaxID=3394362 RepID=UPI0039BCF2B8